jgi:orotate phosphoribosyltransferase
MSHEDILAMFKSSQALLEGHFQLTSGLHSPTYFQCAKVLQYPANAERLCREIAENFRSKEIHVVVAPALGGVVVGQEVGRQLSTRTIFAERKDHVLQLRRGFKIDRGEHVLVCEDVITTGGSVKEVIEIVGKCGGVFAGVAAIVDRSGGTSGLPDLFATMTMEVVTYPPKSCPLCSDGVPLEKPGSRPKMYR